MVYVLVRSINPLEDFGTIEDLKIYPSTFRKINIVEYEYLKSFIKLDIQIDISSPGVTILQDAKIFIGNTKLDIKIINNKIELEILKKYLLQDNYPIDLITEICIYMMKKEIEEYYEILDTKKINRTKNEQKIYEEYKKRENGYNFKSPNKFQSFRYNKYESILDIIDNELAEIDKLKIDDKENKENHIQIILTT